MTQYQNEPKNSEEKPDLFTENGNLRRNNRGCKSKDFYNWPEQSLDDMDSPLAVQQYIQQLIRRDPANIDEILKLPEGQDLGAWKIEHLRLFCMQLNRLATRLQECCQPETCNQMTATEQWIFLCAAHKQPNECPAIDYTRHTLDGAASLLNSNKYFPSRVTIKESSVVKLGSVCRRIYRIFSHAYYHHFLVFDDFERETHLCKRFSKFVTTYELMSKDSLIVPSDGSKPDIESGSNQQTEEQAAATTTQNDPTKDVIKQEVNRTDTEPNTTSEGKNKKSTIEETSSSPSTWTGVSTNTMLKGTSASTTIASKGDALSDGTTSKQIDGDPINSSPSTTTNLPRPIVPPKIGLERSSEA